MIRQPTALPWLSYAWLAEASLFVRCFRAFSFDIAKTGGPGTGGLLLMVPFAPGAILLAPLCFFLAWGLHQGAGLWLIRLFSGVGLGIGVGLTALLAFPVALIVGILLLLLLFSGCRLEALALVGLPVLLVATVLITSGSDVRAWLEAARAGQGEAPGLLHFLRAAAVALAIFVLPAALTWSRNQAAAIAARHRPPPPTAEEQAALTQSLEAAIRADDPAPLASPAVWQSSFFLPFVSTTGDALQLAIGLRKPAAVRALAAQKKGRELSSYGADALRYGLVAAGADPARKGSDGASALDALAAMPEAPPELRAALQRRGR